MAESELEKEVKEIKKNIDDLTEKVDFLIDKSTEKELVLEKREGLKGHIQSFGSTMLDSFASALQFFISGIVGAVSAVLIDAYVKYPSSLFAGAIIAILFGFSLFFGYIMTIVKPEKKRKRKLRLI